MAPIRGVPVRVAELGDRSVISGAKVLASYIHRAKRDVPDVAGREA
jgi:hypothetical protein